MRGTFRTRIELERDLRLRARAARVLPAVPTGGAARDRRGPQRRGPGAVATRLRPGGAPGRVHPRARGNGPHRRGGGLRAGRSVPPGSAVAGPGARHRGVRQRVASAVRAARVPRLPMLAALEQEGLPASTLILELTETTLMRDSDEALSRLNALNGLGLRLAIDDFGTGVLVPGVPPAVPRRHREDRPHLRGRRQRRRAQRRSAPRSRRDRQRPRPRDPWPKASRPSNSSDDCSAKGATPVRASTSAAPSTPPARRSS